MSDLKETQVRRLDFMLLLVLREGVRLRKLSRVADRLGVTQTAISHSVGRLRSLFGDELFIRRPHGVEPTARAIELAAIAGTVLEAAGTMLTGPVPFDPATEERVLRICALDFEVALMADIVGTLRRQAPGIRLQFHALARDAAVAALERNEADIWVGFARNLPGACQTLLLFDETYRVIAREDHPRLGRSGTVGLETYCAEHHVVAAPGGTAGGIVDEALHREGRSRRVAVHTSGFLSALDLVSRTDLVATVPARLAHARAATFRLAVHDPPIALRPFSVAATWHRRASGDRAIRWLVERLGDLL